MSFSDLGLSSAHEPKRCGVRGVTFKFYYGRTIEERISTAPSFGAFVGSSRLDGYADNPFRSDAEEAVRLTEAAD